MPKKKTKVAAVPKAPMTKRELSRWQKQKRQERIALIAVVSVIVVVAGILLYGVWHEIWSRPGQVVARVGSSAITLGELKDATIYRAKVLDKQIGFTREQLYEYQSMNVGTEDAYGFLIQYVQQQLQQLQSERLQLGYSSALLEEMIEDKLVRQEVARRGGAVTAADIDANIRLQYQPTPEPTAIVDATGAITSTTELTSTEASAITATLTPAPTATPIPEDAWKTNLAQTLPAYEVSEADFRRFTIEPSVWRSQLTTMLGATLPTTAEQVRARHILVATEQEAQDILNLLTQQAASFEELAAASSTDTTTKDEGGDLGWFTRGTMAAEFEAAAFSLEPGQISAPISTTYGVHIIKVEEKDANRPLSEDQLSTAKSTAFNAWLTDVMSTTDIQRSFDADKQTWLNKQLPEAAYY